MNIYLTDLTTNSRFTFPMIPQSIDVESGTAFQSYDIMEIGEVKFPYGQKLTRISWSGMFPGVRRMASGAGYIVAVKDPKAVQSWFDELIKNGSKCRLLITETPINLDVYVEDYTMTYEGGYGDYMYEISFAQARDLKVKTEANIVDPAPPPQNNRPADPPKNTYTVVGGDTLWGIAEKYLGSGSRWQEIYNLNKSTIEGTAQDRGMSSSSNGHWIFPGESLILP